FSNHGVGGAGAIAAGHTIIAGQTTTADIAAGKPDYGIKAQLNITGRGWHSVFVSWDQFAMNKAQTEPLEYVKSLVLATNAAMAIKVRNITLVRGRAVALFCQERGHSVPRGATATYEVWVGNPTDKKIAVALKFDTYGWESMTPEVSPAEMELQPGEGRRCEVRVQIPQRVTPGIHEKQVLHAIANGNPGETLELITVSALPHPYIQHTEEAWDSIREKVRSYPWAAQARDEYLRKADAWQVPEPHTQITGSDNRDKGLALFDPPQREPLTGCGIAWQLTKDRRYASKIATFLRRLCDPVHGYPATFRAGNQAFVQEGEFFQWIAIAYDNIAASGVLTAEDQKNIEHTFRLFYETVDRAMRSGAINNWNVAEVTGALYCALAIQDWTMVVRMFSGPAGILDQFSNGVMNDGWWYECSVSYNTWCTTEFSQVAIALQPWGIDFKDMQIPMGTTPYYSLSTQSRKPGLYGINFEKWGPVTRNAIGIKAMWDAIPRFADYRGVMFGVNDATENHVAGQPYELAYYLYHDPEYAAVIRRGNRRDLLYGVPNLPDTPSTLDTKSAYADNIGIVMLRSQTKDRPLREQLQAALHYGTDGGFHGHFDRTNLLSMMRYGRSFYNPEMIWYGYPSYMYKFYVQTSMSKNMVVVDQKMQEPVESFRKLFYTGNMMQAAMVETDARWSNPPYGGMRYDYLGNISLAEKCRQEGRSIALPARPPAYGELTGFTEPVLQRRLMIVMDDYIILADYLHAAREHTYDWLFQGKGFQNIQAPQKQWLRHDRQMNPDPLGAAQFITDCDWWQTTGASKTSFAMRWGKDADNSGTRSLYNEDGPLNIDVITAWPHTRENMIGTAPEDHELATKVRYKILGDDSTLAAGETGAWILGSVNIDEPLKNIHRLQLHTSVERVGRPTLFWGNLVVRTADGKTIPLKDLPQITENIRPVPAAGKDYFGGPVKLGGEPCTNSLPAVPADAQHDAVISVDLTGVGAVRLSGILGGDFPLGGESQRRKTYAVRTHGKTTSYLTVIEPYESQAMVLSAEASDADHLKVTLADGRVQEIVITGL
ncbi:MAG TPA: hypothetical protein VG605_22930, partial [Puia sp.]|nr:hypothetical protein [Puia sp.]